ncbi:DUF3243 domain-containing protein [Falsibacillus albus]|uniref:DUF3243 domain-containing protein n=1 Tax=Falsibacillus albus TaxID=2478915 RepID=A0A3L7K500_9BACI|nr:DUF3243 domain-containing protein [Falsibacillus albus]RLQ97151.1 DUF3243 domain-containing protein [Falsibacillus albus]
MSNHLGKVEEKLKHVDGEEKEQILQSFDDFKQYLADKVELGEKLGLNEEQLAMAAEKIADHLAKREDPKNREEHLLNELWSVGSKEQQHHLAHMLVRLVKAEK